MRWIGSCFFSSRRRHTRSKRDWSSDVCSSDLFVQPSDVGLEVVKPIVDGLGASVAGKEHFVLMFIELLQEAFEVMIDARSEERRVGKECRCLWTPEQLRKKNRECTEAVVGQYG